MSKAKTPSHTHEAIHSASGEVVGGMNAHRNGMTATL